MAESFFKVPACIIEHTVAQNNVASGGAIVAFDTTRLDNSSMADLANNRMVVPVTGLYLVTGWIQWDSTAGGTGAWRMLAVYVNGASTPMGYKIMKPCGSAVAPRYTVEGAMYLDKGDIVTLRTQDTTGSTGDIIVARLSAFMLDRKERNLR